MAKNIPLGSKPQAPAQPEMQTPPPAEAIPRGLPLGVGDVTTEAPSRARAVPSSSAELPESVRRLAAATRQQAADLPPPVPLDTPPLKVETVDLRSLPAERQQQILRGVQEMTNKPKAPVQPVTMASQAVPGWRPPGQAAPEIRPQPVQVQSQPVAAPETGDVIEVPAPASPPETPAADRLNTLGGPTITHCPHCYWELARPDIPEPSYAEKQAFLQSVLGQKPFMKSYNLLGGELQVCFRTLTTRELDEIYAQTVSERQRGKVLYAEDQWEQVNRYRSYLQLAFVRSSAFEHDLPDGYSRETNPHAQAYWEFDPDDLAGEPTALPLIEKHLLEHVLVTETFQRTVSRQLAAFNRLVAKLEGLVDNHDFWKRTGAQS